MRFPLLAAASLCACAACSTGCSTLPASGSAAEVKALSDMDYPAKSAYGADLAVIVTREGRRIRLNNTDTVSMRDCVLWVNREYACQFPLMRIGTENVADLTACINRHQEPFPVGYLLRPDMDRRVVLVELFDPAKNVRHRLVARPPRDPYSEK